MPLLLGILKPQRTFKRAWHSCAERTKAWPRSACALVATRGSWRRRTINRGALVNELILGFWYYCQSYRGLAGALFLSCIKYEQGY